ncbi:MAG: T9SS type A sorting domain-containing protein [Melioribacteraceae bacterium]|nr:T9SS type A sorting domain-containing protein [Melioribacteraceae bacterium]
MSNLFRIITMLAVVVLTASVTFSQEKDELLNRHKESAVERSSISLEQARQITSPAYNYSSEYFTMIQVNVNDHGYNIIGDAANEPSIAVDYNDLNRMAIGWRQFDSVFDSFRQAGYGYTTDGGLSWIFPGVIDPGVFRSDPVLDSDSKGNFYYNSLTSQGNEFSCVVFKSSDGGATWDNGRYAYGGDKQWMTIDKTNGPGNGHIYAFWTYVYSICPPNAFVRSTNSGATFQPCTPLPGNPYWGTLAVAKNGDLFIGGISVGRDYVVIKSTTAKDKNSNVTWSSVVPVDLNGTPPTFGGPNPSGLLGQTIIAVDTSDTEHSGNVYLLASTNPRDNKDNLDVVFARSTNGGTSWEAPVRINDDNTLDSYQWFGTMSVASNGRIDVVWLDTRNYPGTYISELYYSFSTDGGISWRDNIRLSEGFDPHIGWPNQQKMGDYFDMISDEDGVHLAWCGTFNNEQDVYYGRINTSVIVGIKDSEKIIPNEFVLMQNYPNPFNPSTMISYQLSANSKVSLKIYDVLGREIATIVNKQLQPGEYEVEFNAEDLSSGVYYYRLEAGSYNHTKKMILLR